MFDNVIPSQWSVIQSCVVNKNIVIGTFDGLVARFYCSNAKFCTGSTGIQFICLKEGLANYNISFYIPKQDLLKKEVFISTNKAYLWRGICTCSWALRRGKVVVHKFVCPFWHSRVFSPKVLYFVLTCNPYSYRQI